MKLDDMKIGTKIAGAMLCVGVIGLGSATMGSFELHESDKSYSELLATRPAALLATARATRATNDVIGQAYKYLASPAQSELHDGAKKRLLQSHEAALVQLKTGKAAIRGHDSEFDSLIKQVDAIRSEVEHALTFDNIDEAKALAILEAADAKVAATVQQIVAFNDSLFRETSAFNEQQSASVNTMILLLIGGSLLGILLGIAGALWMSSRSISRPLARLKDTMEALATGDFNTAIDGQTRRDEVGDMAKAVLVFKENGLEMQRLAAQTAEHERVAAEERRRNEAERQRVEMERAALAKEQEHVVGLLASGLEMLSRGDLTYRINDQVSADYLKLRDDFNGAVKRLAETVSTIQTTAVDVANAAREINTGANDLSKRTEEQASSLEETAATTEQLAASVKASAQSSRQAVLLANEATEVAERGGAIVNDAVSAMARIEQASRKISDITSVIDEIAFQTNLLALNAAVEAARAGDAGKGFAVVASEVRTLAQRSGEAAKDITALINESSMEVEQGVGLVRSAGEALGKIVEASKKVSTTVSDIASASTEQANGIDEMSQTVAHMDEMTQQNAALAEESAASANSLNGQLQRLNGLVSSFRIKEERAMAARRAEATDAPLHIGMRRSA